MSKLCEKTLWNSKVISRAHRQFSWGGKGTKRAVPRNTEATMPSPNRNCSPPKKRIATRIALLPLQNKLRLTMNIPNANFLPTRIHPPHQITPPAPAPNGTSRLTRTAFRCPGAHSDRLVLQFQTFSDPDSDQLSSVTKLRWFCTRCGAALVSHCPQGMLQLRDVQQLFCGWVFSHFCVTRVLLSL